MTATSKIRVLRIIARMNIGGPAIQLTGLMENLSKEEFDQHLLSGQCGSEEIDFLESKKLTFAHTSLEHLHRNIGYLSDLKTLLQIRKIILVFKPDIIHTHTAKAGFLGRTASILTNKHHILVHTFHGHLLHGYFGSVKTRLLVFAERMLARYTEVLVTVGEKVRDDLLSKKIGKSDQYRVIGPGLDLKKLPERLSSTRRYNVPEDKFIVSWIGRLVPVKAPNRILEIARECAERNLNTHFVVVGNGPLIEDIKAVAIKDELPITLLGWQTEIESILCMSDLVMLTSENEGTPISLIQAQMAGIPVITTNVGSASEVLIHNHSGFSLDYSPVNFADKIEFLISNPDTCRAFGKVGLENSRLKFSLERLVNNHANLYRELIDQSKS